MKTTNKNLTQNNYTTKPAHALLEKISAFMRINNTLNHQTEITKFPTAGLSRTKESEAIKIEAEIRRSQAVTYASMVHLK